MLALCAPLLLAPLAAPLPEGRAVRIACVGDSITWGHGVADREHCSYPALLGALLGEGYEVRNLGVSGSTLLCKGDLPYWDQPAYREALAFEPDIVTIKLGTNDTKSWNWAHEAEFVQDYKDLIASFRALPTSPRVVLCLPAPAFVEGDDISGARVREQLLPRIRQVAHETGCEVVDLHIPLLHHQDFVPDAIHPNGFGMEVIARKLYEVLAFPADDGFDLRPGLPAPVQEGSFHGYRQLTFAHEGRECIVVQPWRVARGRPWIWRPAFFGWEPQTDIALLEQGFHVVYCDITHLYGAPEALAIWDRFYTLTQELGLDRKPVLEGISRGGLAIHNWAREHPDRVSVLFGYTPVMDIKSWPGGKGAGKPYPELWQDCLQLYGFTEEQALAYRGNPVDNAPAIAAARIPVVHYVGLADVDVPVAENTEPFAKALRAAGGEIEVIGVPGMGHHPATYNTDDPAPIVDFILRHLGRKAPFAALPTPSAEFRGEAAGWGGGCWWDQFAKLNGLAAEHGKQIRVLFLGDSITQGWTGSEQRLALADGARSFDRFYGARGAASFGLSGDRTEHVLYRIARGNLEGLDPEVVVLMIGVNNIWSRRNTGEEIAAGTEAIVRVLRERLPGAKVLLLGGFPTGATADCWERQQVDRLHARIAPLADGDAVRYLDQRGLFLTADGTPDYERMSEDNVHLKGPGYDAWAEAMEPTLREMLGE